MAGGDDARRARRARDDERLEDLVAFEPGTPAVLGRVTTPAGLLGPDRFFKLQPVTFAGSETEGGSGGYVDSGSPILVVARGGQPATGDLVVADATPHRWSWTPDSPACTWNTVCVTAVSSVGDITGATVQADRVWTEVVDGVTVEHLDPIELPAGAVTDAQGRYCFRVPITLPDPVDPPTVDPVGGVAVGLGLAVGTYVASVTWLNRYGETKASPPSPAFQVGIPDPASIPVAADLALGASPGAVGALARGIYYFRHSYGNASGETPVGNPLRVRVGVADPTAGFDILFYGDAGGLLPPGTYLVRWAATDGMDVTATVSEGSFAIDPEDAGNAYCLAGYPTLPEGATGFRVYLSPDGGTTWYEYLSHVLPAEDSSIGDFAIALDAALPSAPVALPSGNTFPDLTPRLVFPFEMATLRPYAQWQLLYISKTAVGGYHRYGASQVGASHDCVEAYVSTGAVPQTLNTTAPNVARVTFAIDAGATSTRVYARRADGACRWFAASTSPRDLSGGATGVTCPPAFNSTGQGKVRVTLTPPGYGAAHRDVTITSICTSYALGFPQASLSYSVAKCLRAIDGGGGVAAAGTDAAGADVEITGPGGLFTYSAVSAGSGFVRVDVPWPGGYDVFAELDPWGSDGDTISVDAATFSGFGSLGLDPGPDLACGCAPDRPVPVHLTGSDKYGSFPMTWTGTRYAGEHTVTEAEAGAVGTCGSAAYECLKAGGSVTILYELTCQLDGYGTQGFYLTKSATICRPFVDAIQMFADCGIGPVTRLRADGDTSNGTTGFGHDASATYGPSPSPFSGPISLSFTFTDGSVSAPGYGVGIKAWGDTVTFSS